MSKQATNVTQLENKFTKMFALCFWCSFSIIITVCSTAKAFPTSDPEPGIETLIDRCTAVLDGYASLKNTVNKLELDIAQQNIKLREMEDVIENQRKLIRLLTETRPPDQPLEYVEKDNEDILPSNEPSVVAVNETNVGSQTNENSDDQIKVYKKNTITVDSQSKPYGFMQSTTHSERKRRATVQGEISFSAYLSHTIDHMAPGHVIKCDTVIMNDGNSYNQHTGVFTVPITGVYLMTFTIDSSTAAHVQLVVDGSNISDVKTNTSWHSGSFQVMGSNTVIIRLTQGQSVWMQAYSVSNVISDEAYRLTTLSGVLLY